MQDREAILREARRQVNRWRDKIRRLITSPGFNLKATRESYLSHCRGLLSRFEATVETFEALREARGESFELAQARLRDDFRGLQTTWDGVVARLSALAI